MPHKYVAALSQYIGQTVLNRNVFEDVAYFLMLTTSYYLHNFFEDTLLKVMTGIKLVFYDLPFQCILYGAQILKSIGSAKFQALYSRMENQK